MAATSKTYEVFISHSIKDAPLAAQVANACRGAGIEAVTTGELLPGADASDALWEAVAESRALLTILSPSGPTPSMAIEIGAARAWNKPIYALVTDPSSTTRLPPTLSGIRLYTTGRLQEVIASVKLSVQQLSDVDREYLIEIYAEMGVGADQLALEPRQLEDLVRRFSRGRGKVVPGE